MSVRRWISAFAGLAALTVAGGAMAAPKDPPKLIVVISVDQLSGNLYAQYRPRFTKGLRTLSDQGLVYANGWQSHANTETCPGHSTILTGKHPNKTGIPANDWIDPVSGKPVYCLSAPANSIAGGAGGLPVGPDNMRASTLGDWLKDGGAPSRVFGISGKDRGAITMAGHKADGVFWYREGFGFTTYVEPGQDGDAKLGPVRGINAQLKARFAATPPAWTYEQDVCRALERDYQVGSVAFRAKVPPAKFVFDTSPLLDDVTVDGALHLLAEQKLGQGPGVDILAVSLSATDRIGHSFGTQGPETCEQMYRLDANIGRLLDAVTGLPGGAIVVLTADHGGSDYPERSAERGFPEARRIDPGIVTRLNASLKAQFKLTEDPANFDGWGLFIVGKDRVRLPQPLRGKVAAAAVAVLKAEPDVVDAFTTEELLKTPPPRPGTPPEEYSLRERAALSTVEGRSTDVSVILRPGIAPLRAPGTGGAMSTHGSTWDYDRRVPILFWWPGSEGQERFFSIETIDIAPTLAHLIGVAPPADIDGRCLDLGGFAVAACPKPAVAAAPVEAKKAGFRWPWEKAQ
ncbi:sulfatase-like hydrolase/transferase [Caulobacter sp. SLTY]|uniref:alkaline phosphatase family protein n=1 Tax=Caulobacter sp. SLTY TaxID=2683262 RepID=UPI001411F688|nr:alkaline phosphatase family protein [Caulobacter sp. SLTY]NBB15619.1 sulfatase-like hydrolase/transferase [Caulobacter sp. SLTY]